MRIRDPIVGVILGFTGCAANAGEYSLVKLGTLPGGTFSNARGINNHGRVVGSADTANGETHAFVYANGRMTDLGTLPGGHSSNAAAINDAGEVVGTSQNSAGASRAFLYRDGTMIDLGTLAGDQYSEARDINEVGQVVGQSVSSGLADGVVRAFLYADGAMQDLGFAGDVFRSAYAINDNGDVVGSADLQPGVRHAFRYANGVTEDLGTLPGFDGSVALGINDAGVVVGDIFGSVPVLPNGFYAAPFRYSSGALQEVYPCCDVGRSDVATDINESGDIVGFSSFLGGPWIYSDGEAHDLNTLLTGPLASTVTLEGTPSINDDGQIAATGTDSTGAEFGYLASPVGLGGGGATDPITSLVVLAAGAWARRMQGHRLS